VHGKGAFADHRAAPTVLNGLPGFVVHTPEGTKTVALEVADDRIVAIYSVRNPDKVRHLS